MLLGKTSSLSAVAPASGVSQLDAAHSGPLVWTDKTLGELLYIQG